MLLAMSILCVMEWILLVTGANIYGAILVWICILYVLQSVYMNVERDVVEESVTENLVCMCTVLLSIVMNSVANNGIERAIKNIQVLEKCVYEIGDIQEEILEDYVYKALCEAERVVKVVISVK